MCKYVFWKLILNQYLNYQFQLWSVRLAFGNVLWHLLSPVRIPRQWNHVRAFPLHLLASEFVWWNPGKLPFSIIPYCWCAVVRKAFPSCHEPGTCSSSGLLGISGSKVCQAGKECGRIYHVAGMMSSFHGDWAPRPPPQRISDGWRM